jgi:F0F1-type ATP synthase membrane subunit b/b'
MPWKLINFAIFAAGLGYVLSKLGPRFFNARSADIQKAIKDATGLKIDADFRYAEIDKRMANLGSEVDKLKAEAKTAMEREHQRLLRDTQEDEEYIRKSTTAEIEALRVEGAREVRSTASQRAFALAEKRLAASDLADGLREFANLVERGKN